MKYIVDLPCWQKVEPVGDWGDLLGNLEGSIPFGVELCSLKGKMEVGSL